MPPLMTVMSVSSVTPSSVPPDDASSTAPDVVIVPPLMRPLPASRRVPPVPFRVSVPPLVSVLLSTASPPWKFRLANSETVIADSRLTVAPLTMASPPPLIV